MNLKTADNLLNLRKASGLSQEELAEKIGVSRQAVSKWERGEASPDTDNFIALSEVYGVTLDELIKGKKQSDDIKDAAETDTETETENNGQEHKDKINFSFKNGIHIESEDGETVVVNRDGVHLECSQVEVNVKDGERSVHTNVPPSHVDINDDGVTVKDADGNVISHHNFPSHAPEHAYLAFPYFAVAITAYVLFGIFNVCGGWSLGWIVLLTIPLYYSLGSAIVHRNASHFAFPVLVTMVYLYLGFYFSLWHPGWVMFLIIPVYYFLCEFFKKLISKI